MYGSGKLTHELIEDRMLGEGMTEDELSTSTSIWAAESTPPPASGCWASTPPETYGVPRNGAE
ncbi:hypothetical protein ENSA7_39390 [Enhygromyxa salina]|uniref:Uncharacterized protein n=1 Tax=Enhygromyxa salina TaxID=215803 RepID=A0A2S9YMS3_9BACT|nr:hypothetical protein ENSA7_39390 [Enhygromyxa salina]